MYVRRFRSKVITFSRRWRESGHYSLHLIYRRRTRKQWLSKQHFAENTSERPHIDTLRVPEYVSIADKFKRKRVYVVTRVYAYAPIPFRSNEDFRRPVPASRHVIRERRIAGCFTISFPYLSDRPCQSKISDFTMTMSI